jgi:branched-subunit amino acid transport protein AzlD
MARGFEFISDEPIRYMRLSISRIADFFMFWPSRETTFVNNLGRVLSFGLFLPLMIYGLWLSRSRWRELQLLYLFIVFYTVLHLMTWSMIRYRLPVDAVLLIFAAIALTKLTATLKIWRILGNESTEKEAIAEHTS